MKSFKYLYIKFSKINNIFEEEFEFNILSS